MDILYFGCWNRSGHYLFGPGGQSTRGEDGPCYFGDRIHIDGALAPRRGNKSYRGDYGKLVWAGQGTSDERMRIQYDSEEYPQGQFLLHHLDNGFTAIQWWDRNQGDSRGACNSTFLWRGTHTAEEMVAGLKQYFPHIVDNLAKAGIELIDVTPSPPAAREEKP